LSRLFLSSFATARKSLGAYAIYCSERLVALVCDDKLFIKPTSAGRAFIGRVIEAPPYKGAKPYFLISGEKWDDGNWMSDLVRVSVAELPLAEKKKKPANSGAKKHPASSHRR
jgi:DNA transformation protein and related proteins